MLKRLRPVNLNIRAVSLPSPAPAPLNYGAALWLRGSLENSTVWVYEVDVEARGATSVLPASVGKIKAIYR